MPISLGAIFEVYDTRAISWNQNNGTNSGPHSNSESGLLPVPVSTCTAVAACAVAASTCVCLPIFIGLFAEGNPAKCTRPLNLHSRVNAGQVCMSYDGLAMHALSLRACISAAVDKCAHAGLQNCPYMLIDAYVCTYIPVQRSLYVCICTYIYCMRIRVCGSYLHMHTYMNPCVFVPVCIGTYARVYTCMYRHVYTHVHVHAYTSVGHLHLRACKTALMLYVHPASPMVARPRPACGRRLRGRWSTCTQRARKN